jgi:hypothetical protein
MLSKSPCQHCKTNIEFDVEAAGSLVQCPACEKQTRLLVTAASTPQPKSPENLAKRQAALLRSRMSQAEPVENKLETFGNLFFWGGIVTAFCMLIWSTLSYGLVPFRMLIIVAATIVQGIVIRMLFQAAAEAIRLLRKISAKQ